MTKYVLKSVFIAAILGATLSTHAATITTQATADTTVGQPWYWTPTGAWEGLYAVAPDGYISYPLIQFDLSSFAGSTVTADAELKVTFSAAYFTPSMRYELRTNGAAWSEATTTWGNFDLGGSTLLSTKTVDGNLVNRGDQVSFAIPKAVVQSWIDHGASNFGVRLQTLDNTWHDRDQHWFSREYTPANGNRGDWAPTLTFTAAVPEPETYAMLFTGLGLIGVMARRRKSNGTNA